MSYQPLFEKLAQGARVLTVNQRLARHLTARFMRSQKQSLVETPAIQSLSDFCLQQYQHRQLIEPLPIMLNALQQQMIWEEVIADADTELALLNPAATAKTLQKAYRNLLLWELDWKSLSANSEETVSFQQWAKRFDDRLQSLGAFTLEHFLSQLNHPAETQIVALGFDDWPPAYQSMSQRWAEQGCVLSTFELSKQAVCHQAAVKTKAVAYHHAAHWAKSIIENDPQASIGIVVPDCQSERVPLVDSFQSVFSPNDWLNAKAMLSGFTITGGQPLTQFAIVNHALAIWQSQLYFDKVAVLKVLGSPYTTLQTNTLDALAQTLRPFPSSPNALEKELQSIDAAWHWPDLNTPKEKQGLAAWCQYFLSLLKHFGWPGQMTLNSEEHQVVARLYRALEDLNSLQILLDELEPTEALTLISKQLAEITFQVESEREARVEIMGVLEAGGILFDHLMILGMNHNTWPATAKPNPYLPIELQREQGMPHASADREYAFAQAVIDGFLGQAKSLLAVCAEQEGDMTLRPSALIEDWPFVDLPPVAPTLLQQAFASVPGLELVSDVAVPAIELSAIEDLKAGLQIFKKQALCPFQAFAALRLKLRAWEPEDEPLNLAFRGSVLHRLLETLWQTLRTQKQLLSMDQEALKALVEEHTLDAILSVKRQFPEAMPAFLQALEKQRLVQLILAWLTIEKRREPFEVLAEEQRLFGHIANIPVNVRVDRIDQCDDQRLVIDYKTGYASRLNWFDERPSEPQMPIYALLTGATGIAYAKVKAAEMAFDGVAETALIEGVSTVAQDKYTPAQRWSDLLSHWRQVFQGLAESFLSGDVRIDPKSPQAACRQCDFARLCRHHFKE